MDCFGPKVGRACTCISTRIHYLLSCEVLGNHTLFAHLRMSYLWSKCSRLMENLASVNVLEIWKVHTHVLIHSMYQWLPNCPKTLIFKSSNIFFFSHKPRMWAAQQGQLLWSCSASVENLGLEPSEVAHMSGSRSYLPTETSPGLHWLFHVAAWHLHSMVTVFKT